MTIEELEQLKHGDIVLVELEVMKDSFNGKVCNCGSVLVRHIGTEKAIASLKPFEIIKKVRKLQSGDIVWYNKALYRVVCNNETIPGTVYITNIKEKENSNEIGFSVEANDIELICSVDNREDRKEDA